MYQKIKNKNELASTVRHHSTLDPSLKEFLLFSYHPSSKVLLWYISFVVVAVALRSFLEENQDDEDDDDEICVVSTYSSESTWQFRQNIQYTIDNVYLSFYVIVFDYLYAVAVLYFISCIILH